MNEEEIWKDVVGFEGLYEVSNLGRIKSKERIDEYISNGELMHRRRREVILFPKKLKTGYLQVTLYKNGKYICSRIHRLVAEAFLPNPNNFPVVNHKDEIKTNNFVNNLEWCTIEYNNNYGTHQQRAKEKRSKPVIGFDDDGEEILKFNSVAEARRNGVSNVSHSIYNNVKTIGLYWKFK
jgi:hypothetical protein